MVAKFKAGDKVVAKSTYAVANEGEVYTIAGYARATELGEWVYLSELRNNASDDGSFLEKNFEPVAVAGSNGKRFKVGDRVRVIRSGDDDGGSSHSAKIGEEFTVTKIYDEPEAEIHTNVWYFYPHEIELVDAPLTLQAGCYYRTRDGRKVGPVAREEDYFVADGYHYNAAGICSYEGKGRNLPDEEFRLKHDIIALWVDEPVLDTSTAGFTVPLDAPEFGGAESKFKVGDRVHYKDAYCEGTGVIHSDNDAENGYGWFVTVEEKDSGHAPFDDNTTRIFTEDKLRLVAEATTAQEPPTSIADIVRRLERLESAMWQRAA